MSAPLLTIHNRHPAACGIPPALSTEVADLYIATSERAGLPTVQVSTMTPVAVMVGANRIVAAAGIIHPLGNAELSPAEEKALRRRIVESALRALATEVVAPTVFAPDDPAAGARASEPPAREPADPARRLLRLPLTVVLQRRGAAVGDRGGVRRPGARALARVPAHPR